MCFFECTAKPNLQLEEVAFVDKPIASTIGREQHESNKTPLEDTQKHDNTACEDIDTCSTHDVEVTIGLVVVSVDSTC